MSQLAVITLIALAARVAWIGAAWRHDPFLAYPDESLHWELASNLATTGDLVTNDGRFAARMPLYPLFLAPFAALGEPGVVAARLAQAVLGAASAALVAAVLRRAAGANAAWLGGLLVALDPFAIFFCNLLLSETIFTTLLIAFAAAAAAMRSASAPAWSAAAVLAITGAALVLTRPSAALLPPLAWLLIAAGAAHRGAVLRRLALAPLAIALVLLPWGLRNRAVIGDFAWLSTNGGVTLYDAQGPQARGDSDQSFLRDMPEVRALGEVEQDAALRRLAVDHMRRDPRRVLELAGAKLARTWNPFPNVAEHRSRPQAWAGAAHSLAVYALAVGGLARLCAQRPGAALGRRPRPAASRDAAPPASPAAAAAPASSTVAVAAPSAGAALTSVAVLAVVYFSLVHAVYVGSVRYRLPLTPLMAMAGAACVSNGRSTRDGQHPIRADRASGQSRDA